MGFGETRRNLIDEIETLVAQVEDPGTKALVLAVLAVENQLDFLTDKMHVISQDVSALTNVLGSFEH